MTNSTTSEETTLNLPDQYSIRAINEDGTDGEILYTTDKKNWTPMTGTLEYIQSLLPIVKEICKKTGQKFRICQFAYKGEHR